ncbi:MAG TPA: CPBP family glutamic-type intramembrane protease [Vicinamibacteria bacterium]|jgi:hypothetical protein
MEREATAEARVDAYLAEVRAGLGGLPPAKAAEIVVELRSHIDERARREGTLTDEAVSAALRGLGPAAELAAQYAGEPAPQAPRPALGAGLLGLCGTVVASVLAASFVVAALAKPFVPDRAGLWRIAPDSYSLRLGFGGAVAPGSDALGWWFVPLGLGAGALLFVAGARLGGWSLRRLRLPAAGPLVLCELLAVLGIFLADEHGLVPFSKTPFLLLVGWGSLRLRRLSWRDVGLRAPASWPRTLLIGVVAGVVIQRLELWVMVPLLQRLTGELPDVSVLQPLVGNLKVLAVVLLLNWTLAAVGEEMVNRGYLMNRVAGLFGGGGLGWAVSLIAVNAVFGLGHAYQGLSGQVEAAVSGLLLGALYLACRRELWAPVLAHGVSNTIDLVMIFAGRYPGI